MIRRQMFCFETKKRQNFYANWGNSQIAKVIHTNNKINDNDVNYTYIYLIFTYKKLNIDLNANDGRSTFTSWGSIGAGKCVRASLWIWQTPEFEVGTNIDYLFKRFCRNKISLIQTLVGV